MIIFKTFMPKFMLVSSKMSTIVTATNDLNKWLEENPKVEIIDWQTATVGTANELCITIQYQFKEN